MKSKVLIFILLAVASIGGYVGHQWEKNRKLDEYFIEQFTADWLTQVTRNEPHQHGEIFENAHKKMQEMGYNPQEIHAIMVKGFDRGHAILAQQSQGISDSTTS